MRAPQRAAGLRRLAAAARQPLAAGRQGVGVVAAREEAWGGVQGQEGLPEPQPGRARAGRMATRRVGEACGVPQALQRSLRVPHRAAGGAQLAVALLLLLLLLVLALLAGALLRAGLVVAGWGLKVAQSGLLSPCTHQAGGCS